MRQVANVCSAQRPYPGRAPGVTVADAEEGALPLCPVILGTVILGRDTVLHRDRLARP